MPFVNGVTKDTDNKFLNMYTLDTVNKKQATGKYFLASRAKTIEKLKLKSRKNIPDGVSIYSLYGENQDKVVLVRQYRYAIDDYIYEFPAGLVEEGEDYHDAAVREMKEETGLDLHIMKAPEGFERPFFTTIGLTDESCATVYGISTGEISRAGQEDSEDIEIVIADRTEVRRILREEKVAIICAYMMMHFLQDDAPFEFLT